MPIIAVRMPKWGLAMEEGRVVGWSVELGAAVREGDDLVDIETSKITNVCQAPAGGVLRRVLAPADSTLPVGALLAVISDGATPEAEIETFVANFQATFDPQTAAAEAGGPEIRTVEIAPGRALRVGVAGEGLPGTPLLLLHGFGADLDNWMLLQSELAAERPVFMLELPGHGQSSKEVGAGGLNDLAGAVASAIEALGIARFAIGGHSLGGAVATALAAESAERLAALLLICPAAMPGSALNTDYLDAFLAARRARDLRAPAALLFANADLVSRDMLETLLKAKRLDGAEAALRAISEGLKGADPAYAALPGRLAQVRAPITVIASRADRIVGAPDPTGFPPQTVVHWVEGAGHMPHLEQPGEVARLLSAALRSLP